MKRLLKSFVRQLGYEIRYISNEPRRLALGESTLNIDLDFVIGRALMLQPKLSFVQVGAHNGSLCDPIQPYIQQYDWHGVLIEPQPGPCSQLKERYEGCPGIVVENVAISDRDGSGTLFSVTGADLPDWCDALASFDREHLVRHKEHVPNIEQYITEIEIETATFESVFLRNQIEHVDLLQIDTEGFDAEILRLFPFETYRPAIVNFERIHLPLPVLNDALDRLAKYGYLFALNGSQDLMAFNESYLPVGTSPLTAALS